MGTTSTNDGHAPYSVAIVAMGPSRNEYLSDCIAQSGRFRVADETWAINAMAGIIEHDRAIIMDDLPYFAKVSRTENPALCGYADWLHRHPGPIYTQRAYPQFPGSVEYPLQDVLNSVGYPYLSNTTAYAICLAIHMRVKHIKLYGMDFTMPDRAFAEAGRACLEFWIRDCNWRGIKVSIASTSTLLDQSTNRPLYGYSIAPTITCAGQKFVVNYNR